MRLGALFVLLFAFAQAGYTAGLKEFTINIDLSKDGIPPELLVTTAGVNLSFDKYRYFADNKPYLEKWIKDFGIKIIGVPDTVKGMWFYDEFSQGKEDFVFKDADFNVSMDVLEQENNISNKFWDCFDDYVGFIRSNKCTPYFVIQGLPCHFGKDFASNLLPGDFYSRYVCTRILNNVPVEVVKFYKDTGGAEYYTTVDSMIEALLSHPPKDETRYAKAAEDFFSKLAFHVFSMEKIETVYFDFCADPAQDKPSRKIYKDAKDFNVIVPAAWPEDPAAVIGFFHVINPDYEVWNQAAAEDSSFKYFMHVYTGIKKGYERSIQDGGNKGRACLVGGASSSSVGLTSRFMMFLNAKGIKPDFLSVNGFGDQLIRDKNSFVPFRSSMEYYKMLAVSVNNGGVMLVNSLTGPCSTENNENKKTGNELMNGKTGAMWALEYFLNSKYDAGNISGFADKFEICPPPYIISGAELKYSWGENNMIAKAAGEDGSLKRYLRKPVCGAMEMIKLVKDFKQLKAKALPVPPDSRYRVFTDGSGGIYVLLWNFMDVYSNAGLLNAQDKKETFSIVIDHLPATFSSLYCKRFVINSEKSNSFNFKNSQTLPFDHQYLESIAFSDGSDIKKIDSINNSVELSPSDAVNLLPGDSALIVFLNSKEGFEKIFAESRMDPKPVEIQQVQKAEPVKKQEKKKKPKKRKVK